MNKRTYASLAFVAVLIVGASFTSATEIKAAMCSPSAERTAEINQALAAYQTQEDTYNALAKTLARAGSAPLGYISPWISPGITQNDTITDSLDGKSILRKDLYFAYDQTSQARQACRDGNCKTYTLPTSHNTAAAQTALKNYQNAWDAMPKFAGPAGMKAYGSPERHMSSHDAIKLREELQPKTCSTETDRTTTSTTSTSPTTSTEPVVAPTTTTGTYTLAYVTELLTQIQTLTNKNAALGNEVASLKAQLAAAKSSASASQSSAAAASAPTTSTGSAATASADCPVFTRSISQGASGFDVSTLQSFLAKDPSVYPEGLVTGYFGPATERAVGRWQANKGVAAPGSAGYGTVGPLTRSAILTACY